MTDFDVVREGLGDALNPDYYYEALARIEAQVQRLTEERDGAQTRIAQLEAALRYYARKDDVNGDIWNTEDVLLDGGAIARAALAEGEPE